MTVHKKSSSGPKPVIFIIAAAAAVLLILVAVSLRRPGSETRSAENKLWQQIKQEERILILYESVIGVKAKEFDGKLKTYQYGINEQQLGAGAFLGSEEKEAEPPLRSNLMSMEQELQAEMDLIGLLIRQREEMKEQIARMHFQRKFNHLNKDVRPPSADAASAASPPLDLNTMTE